MNGQEFKCHNCGRFAGVVGSGRRYVPKMRQRCRVCAACAKLLQEPPKEKPSE